MSQQPPTRIGLFWQKNGWVGLLFIGAALLLFGAAAVMTAIAQRERSSATETTGTVARLVVVEPTIADGTAASTGYGVYVDFTVDDQEYRALQSVAEKDFEQFAEGQVVTVEYLPDDPYRIWVAPDLDNWPSDLRFFGWILLPFGLFLVWGPWVVAGQELKKTRH